MPTKKEYVLSRGKNNLRAFPTLDEAKAFADEHVPDPNGNWWQNGPGSRYRQGRDQSLHANPMGQPEIWRRKVTKKTPAVG
jgi:hypothetical protein